MIRNKPIPCASNYQSPSASPVPVPVPDPVPDPVPSPFVPIPVPSPFVPIPVPSPVPVPSPFVPIPDVVPLGLYYDQVDPIAIEVLSGGIRTVPLTSGSPSAVFTYIYDTVNNVFKVLPGIGSFTISGPIMTFTDNWGKNHTLILNTQATR